jgi:predicted Zn-dependent protease
MNHDLSCYKNFFNQWGEIEKSTFESFGPDVIISVDEEVKLGEEAYKEVAEKYKIIKSGPAYEKLVSQLNLLKEQISKFQNPTKNKSFGKYKDFYKIYLIETNEINAFTAGAMIFVTTGIYDFCKTDDELACIIGHEIAHNELGHIQDKLKHQKASQKMFGNGFGDMANIVGSILTTPFNQLNEGHCDLFGVDLAEKAGFQGCKTVTLWKRMNEKSGGSNFMNFFSSHPYSGTRAECCKKYLSTEYNKSCLEK